MNCPECTSEKHCVIGSKRWQAGGESIIRRRRKCLSCGARWWTYEGFEPPDCEAILKLRDLQDGIEKVLKATKI